MYYCNINESMRENRKGTDPILYENKFFFLLILKWVGTLSVNRALVSGF